MGTFFSHAVSSIFRLFLWHTHTMQVSKQVDCSVCRFSKLLFPPFARMAVIDWWDRPLACCCVFLCIVLAATYWKYHWHCLLCLPLVWHLLFIVAHTASCCDCVFHCVVLATAYLKYRLSCLPFIWHLLFIVTHTHIHTRSSIIHTQPLSLGLSPTPLPW